MIIPFPTWLILIFLIIGLVLGKMIFEDIVIPILVIGGIVIGVILLRTLMKWINDGMDDYEEYM